MEIEEVVKSGYFPGGYSRDALRGYIQFYQFKSENIFIDKYREKEVYRDLLFESLLPKEIVSEDSYKKYFEEFKKLWNFEKLSSFSDEQIKNKIDKLRFNFLSLSEKEAIKKYKIEDFKKIFEQLQVEHKNRNLFFGDIEDFKVIMNDGKKTPVLFLNDYKCLPLFLVFISNIFKTKKIKFVINKNSYFTYPEEQHFEIIKKEFPELNISFSFIESEISGFDLKTPSVHEIIRKNLFDENNFIIVLGEDSALTFEGADFNYWIFSQIINDKFSKYIGMIPSMKRNQKKTVIKERTSEWNYPFEKKYSGMERSTYNAISDVDKNRNNYMNIYSFSYKDNKFPFFKIRKDEWKDIILERDKNLKDFLFKNEERGFKYLSAYYDLKTLNKQNYIPEENKDAVLLRGIHFDKQSISIKPYFAGDYNQNLIDIRSFINDNKREEDLSFFINFLYFATENLIYSYNKSIQNNQQEKIRFKDFYIDSFYNGKKSTPSLYKKAFIGLTKDNNLEIGREKLSEGYLEIFGEKIKWEKENINNQRDENEVIVFTPLMFEKNENHGFKVGYDRFNITLVDNKVICMRFGEVYLPPFGVVISLRRDKFEIFRRRSQLEEINDNYYSWKKEADINFFFENNNNVKWKYGGGTLLVKDGENLMKDETTAKNNFTFEGWYNPLSMKTQETQVQDWVRGPRSVIGKDNKGGTFIGVFSGRTKESKGIRFDQMVEILSREVKGLKDVINLDGGSSSCLGLILKNEFFELSYPSATTYTCAGMARPVNSFLIINTRR